ncbi:MAG: hypothetical protein PHE06_07515 [Lachnospiraceae bacterium]|nr:hypothetical protein [Lachnospiraceae bacterium]
MRKKRFMAAMLAAAMVMTSVPEGTMITMASEEVLIEDTVSEGAVEIGEEEITKAAETKPEAVEQDIPADNAVNLIEGNPDVLIEDPEASMTDLSGENSEGELKEQADPEADPEAEADPEILLSEDSQLQNMAEEDLLLEDIGETVEEKNGNRASHLEVMPIPEASEVIDVSGEMVTNGEVVSAEVKEDSGGAWLKFTPASDGNYLFCGEEPSGADTYAALYQVETVQGSDVLKEVTYDDDGGKNSNFRITQYLYKNTTYYLQVRFYYEEPNGGTIPVRLGQLEYKQVTGISLKGIQEYYPAEILSYQTDAMVVLQYQNEEPVEMALRDYLDELWGKKDEYGNSFDAVLKKDNTETEMRTRTAGSYELTISAETGTNVITASAKFQILSLPDFAKQSWVVPVSSGGGQVESGSAVGARYYFAFTAPEDGAYVISPKNGWAYAYAMNYVRDEDAYGDGGDFIGEYRKFTMKQGETLLFACAPIEGMTVSLGVAASHQITGFTVSVDDVSVRDGVQVPFWNNVSDVTVTTSYADAEAEQILLSTGDLYYDEEEKEWNGTVSMDRYGNEIHLAAGSGSSFDGRLGQITCSVSCEGSETPVNQEVEIISRLEAGQYVDTLSGHQTTTIESWDRNGNAYYRFQVAEGSKDSFRFQAQPADTGAENQGYHISLYNGKEESIGDSTGRSGKAVMISELPHGEYLLVVYANIFARKKPCQLTIDSVDTMTGLQVTGAEALSWMQTDLYSFTKSLSMTASFGEKQEKVAWSDSEDGWILENGSVIGWQWYNSEGVCVYPDGGEYDYICPYGSYELDIYSGALHIPQRVRVELVPSLDIVTVKAGENKITGAEDESRYYAFTPQADGDYDISVKGGYWMLQVDTQNKYEYHGTSCLSLKQGKTVYLQLASDEENGGNYVLTIQKQPGVKAVSLSVPEQLYGEDCLANITAELTYEDSALPKEQGSITNRIGSYGYRPEISLKNSQTQEILEDWEGMIPAGTYELSVTVDGICAETTITIISEADLLPKLSVGENTLTNGSGRYVFTVPAEGGAERAGYRFWLSDGNDSQVEFDLDEITDSGYVDYGVLYDGYAAVLTPGKSYLLTLKEGGSSGELSVTIEKTAVLEGFTFSTTAEINAEGRPILPNGSSGQSQGYIEVTASYYGEDAPDETTGLGRTLAAGYTPSWWIETEDGNWLGGYALDHFTGNAVICLRYENTELYKKYPVYFMDRLSFYPELKVGTAQMAAPDSTSYYRFCPAEDGSYQFQAEGSSLQLFDTDSDEALLEQDAAYVFTEELTGKKVYCLSVRNNSSDSKRRTAGKFH